MDEDVDLDDTGLLGIRRSEGVGCLITCPSKNPLCIVYNTCCTPFEC